MSRQGLDGHSAVHSRSYWSPARIYHGPVRQLAARRADARTDARLHVGNSKEAYYRRGKRCCHVAGRATCSRVGRETRRCGGRIAQAAGKTLRQHHSTNKQSKMRYGFVTILIAGFTGLGILLAPPVTLSPAAEKPEAAEIRDTAEIEGQRARGAYLARIGNCLGCHTAYSGFPYAGGHILDTSIGIFITPNITSDKETGIGLWSEEDFWRALHNGRGSDGNLLYPAFPYSEYTRVSREDSDAIFAYLQSLPPVRQRNAPNRINFPFNWRPLLHLWQLIYFSSGIYLPDTLRDDEWNRGAYLVQGLGHCNACHTQRNILGISKGDILG